MNEQEKQAISDHIDRFLAYIEEEDWARGADLLEETLELCAPYLEERPVDLHALCRASVVDGSVDAAISLWSQILSKDALLSAIRLARKTFAERDNLSPAAFARPMCGWSLALIKGDVSDIGLIVRPPQRLFRDGQSSENSGTAKISAGLRHDMRQPLQAGYLFLDALSGRLNKDSTFEELQEPYDNVLNSLYRLGSMLEDTSRKVEQVDLDKLILDVVDEARENARLKNITLIPKRFSASSNRDKLFRIVRELIENAIKYSEAGDPVAVAIEEESPDEIRINVTDIGPGIPAKDLPTIFERGVRLDPTRAEGTGHGLANVAELASQLGHAIEVRSGPELGSTFTVIMKRLAEN